VAVSDDLFKSLPARSGHFALESALFVSPKKLEPLVSALAARLETYRVSGVCGPLLGGAFLAQALAMTLGVDFCFSERVAAPDASDLFTADYRFPPELQRRLKGQRVAVVDDAISAGSSVRATVAAVRKAGGSSVVVGTLLALGTVAIDYFASQSVPVEALARRALTLWKPAECPLCRAGMRLEDPAPVEKPR
jgi:orotate phosphoribosyltransferase